MFGTTLPNFLFLSEIKTTEEIDLTYAVLDSSKQVCMIDLYGTDINKLKFDYSRFSIYKYSDYEKKHISHLYEQILKMQKDKGFIDGYEKADKEYSVRHNLADKGIGLSGKSWFQNLSIQPLAKESF